MCNNSFIEARLALCLSATRAELPCRTYMSCRRILTRLEQVRLSKMLRLARLKKILAKYGEQCST